MMRNARPLLLQQFGAPLFQLPNDGLNAGDLLDFRHSDSCGEAITEMRVWQLNDHVFGVAVDVFVELLEHFDGGV